MIMRMDDEYLLSLILTAYNEEKRLPECMEKAAGFIASHSEPIEVILVENGSSDRTYAMGLEYAKQYPWLQVIHEEKAGKGYVDFLFEPLKKGDTPIILELKYNRSAKNALKCIQERGYLQRFKNHDRVLLVGINYSERTKKHTCLTELVEKEA